MRVKFDKGILKLEGEVEYAETKEVSSFGNGAKIGWHKDFDGREVVVLVMKKIKAKK